MRILHTKNKKRERLVKGVFPSGETLAGMRVGETAVLARLLPPVGRDGERLRIRLLDLGFVPGTEVTVVGTLGGRDLMLIRLRGYGLCIRRSAARGILVTRSGTPDEKDEGLVGGRP